MNNKLIKYLPSYYRSSRVMTGITDTQSEEIEEFIKNIESVFNQFFIDTAADFTLERWEKELGIPVNNTKEDDYRRSAIKSKLKGSGTVTVSLIKNVCESYSNGEVDIIEDNSSLKFTVRFVGVKGIPPNLDDLKGALEEIKPAHLDFDFEYTYNTNEKLAAYTHNELNQYTHIGLREVI